MIKKYFENIVLNKILINLYIEVSYFLSNNYCYKYNKINIKKDLYFKSICLRNI